MRPGPVLFQFLVALLAVALVVGATAIWMGILA